jgi:hypothetical protein
MKKVTWSELEKAMWKFNEEHGYTHKGNEKRLEGIVVFTEDSFTKPYTEFQRSYVLTSDNKAFLPHQLGYSIFADCLDGTDDGVRIDWYMRDDKMPWKVEYCVLLEEGEHAWKINLD